MAVDSASYLVAASCIVHNICELRRDDFLEKWLEDIETAIEQPDHVPLAVGDKETERDATRIRDTLARFF